VQMHQLGAFASRTFIPFSCRGSRTWQGQGTTHLPDMIVAADDGQMLLALAASLVNHHGDCTAVQTATEYSKAFDVFRGYGGHARDVSGC